MHSREEKDFQGWPEERVLEGMSCQGALGRVLSYCQIRWESNITKHPPGPHRAGDNVSGDLFVLCTPWPKGKGWQGRVSDNLVGWEPNIRFRFI